MEPGSNPTPPRLAGCGAGEVSIVVYIWRGHEVKVISEQYLENGDVVVDVEGISGYAKGQTWTVLYRQLEAPES